MSQTDDLPHDLPHAVKRLHSRLLPSGAVMPDTLEGHTLFRDVAETLTLLVYYRGQVQMHERQLAELLARGRGT